MSNKVEQKIYSEIIEELKHLVNTERSGTLFVTTSENHPVRFELNAGQIVALSYRIKHGAGAIPLVLKISSGHTSFTEEQIDPANSDLPNTPSLIAMLESSSGGGHKAHVGNVDVDMDKLAAVMENALLQILGPVAGLIVDDAIDDAEDDPLQALQLVADEIDDLDDQAVFLDKIKSTMGL